MKRHIVGILTIVGLYLLGFATAEDQPAPAQIVRAAAHEDKWWSFDFPNRNAQGDDLRWMPLEVILRFSEPTGTPVRYVRLVLEMAPGTNRVHQSRLLTNVPSGTYHLQAALLNGVGGQSPYSEPPVVIEVLPPLAPERPPRPERLGQEGE